MMVNVGVEPPFKRANVDSIGSVFVWSPEPVKPLVPSSEMLWPTETKFAEPPEEAEFDTLAPLFLARIVLLISSSESPPEKAKFVTPTPVVSAKVTFRRRMMEVSPELDCCETAANEAPPEAFAANVELTIQPLLSPSAKIAEPAKFAKLSTNVDSRI